MNFIRRILGLPTHQEAVRTSTGRVIIDPDAHVVLHIR